MFQGKMKAVTFSYDDGITQDRRMISVFNKYGLKGTFNLNSAKLGSPGILFMQNMTVAWCHPRREEIRQMYEGHEIAGHCLTHPNLTLLDDAAVIREVEEDRLTLSELAGYEVVGLAYPGGTANVDERVVKLIRENTGVKYARTTTSANHFDLQSDLLLFNPTTRQPLNWEELFRMGEEFISLTPDTPKLLYIWGHSFEFDLHNDWDRFSEFCRLISGKSDIFYGTNAEVLLADHEK